MRIQYLVSLVMVALVMALVLIGCGGGSGQDDQSRGSGQEQEQASKKESKKARETQTLRGTVARARTNNRLVLRSSDGKPSVIRYQPENVKVRLDGEEASPDVIAKGQKAEVSYVKVETKSDQEANVARSIKLRSRGNAPAGETTG